MTDDAPYINEGMKLGRPLPAAVLYCTTRLDTGPGVGGALIGAGPTDQARSDNAFKLQPVTEIIDARTDKTEPLLRIRRPRFRVADIGFKGRPQNDNTFEMSDSTLIEVTQVGSAWPVGNITFERVTLSCAKRGWYFAPGSHADHITQHECITHIVDYPYTVNESQSVDHNIDMQCKGNGKIIVDVRDGGRLAGKIRTNGYWDRLLAVGDPRGTFPTKNGGYFDLSVLFDGGDKIGSLFEERFKYEWSRPVVSINGFMADDVLIGADPILLNKAKVRINIERCLKPAYVWEAN